MAVINWKQRNCVRPCDVIDC